MLEVCGGVFKIFVLIIAGKWKGLSSSVGSSEVVRAVKRAHQIVGSSCKTFFSSFGASSRVGSWTPASGDFLGKQGT